MIERSEVRGRIERALGRAPICYLAGPRQSGKTTLARGFLSADDPGYFDLEDPESESRLAVPKLALSQDRPLIVIDEIQRRPDLFPLLRVLADASERKGRYLILGSASLQVIKGVSESLAGRVELVELGGFNLSELGPEAEERLRLRGGLPPSYLAASDADSLSWRKQFLNLVAEKDIPSLGTGIAPRTLIRFLTMTAHYHGQTWNSSEIARSLGLGEASVRRLLDYLEGLYLVRILRPWHENLAKRQVKAPKVYFRDAGLVNALLGIRGTGDLVSHPKSGAVWEGFALESVLAAIGHDEAAFWATHNGAELDLLLIVGHERLGFEFKLSPEPRVTPSMRTALTDLRLDQLYVVHSGNKRWPLGERMEAIPLADSLLVP